MIRIFMIGMSNDKGGVESYITNLCNYLDEKKYEVIYAWPKMTIKGKIWISPPNRHNYLKYRRFWKRFFKENYFDVIYYNACDIVSIDLLKFAKKSGVPVRIIHSHNTDNQLKMNIFHRITEYYNRKIIGNIATNLLACSEEAGKWMFNKEKFTIIKNGIDYQKYQFREEFRKICRESIGVEKERLIGCIGRLAPQKNPFMAIEIMKEVSKLDTKARFVFIGDGELREQVGQKIREYKLSDKIKLLGARDDANKWYSALDCLLMPSLFEGLPFTLVEAQAADLPCVVSDTVSDKANITGILKYISLEDSVKTWAINIINVCKKERKETKQILKDAGYLIEDTAIRVDKIIEEALDKS